MTASQRAPVSFGVCRCGGPVVLFRGRPSGAARTELFAACLDCDLVREGEACAHDLSVELRDTTVLRVDCVKCEASLVSGVAT